MPVYPDGLDTPLSLVDCYPTNRFDIETRLPIVALDPTGCASEAWTRGVLLRSANRCVFAAALISAHEGRDLGHSCLPLETSAVPADTRAVTVRSASSGDGPHQGVVSVALLAMCS